MDGASPAVFEVLLDHRWNIKAHYSEACGDILTSAICGGEYDFAKWLLEHNHDSTPKEGIPGPCAIVETVRGDMASIDMLKLLLDHEIDVEDTGVGVAAADKGNVEGLRLLLDYGVHIKTATCLGILLTMIATNRMSHKVQHCIVLVDKDMLSAWSCC